MQDAARHFRNRTSPTHAELLGDVSELLFAASGFLLPPSPIERLSPAIIGLRTKSALGTLTASLASTVPTRWEPSLFSCLQVLRIGSSLESCRSRCPARDASGCRGSPPGKSP